MCAIVFCLLTSVWLCLPVGAQSYVDNMRDMDNSTIKSYHNLQPMTSSNVPSDVQGMVGPLAHTFLHSGNPVGSATYRIQGADSVEVKIYTWLGTFVSQVPGYPGVYAAGMPLANMNHIYSQPLYNLLLGGNGTLYSYIGGELQRLQGTELFFRTAPTGEAVSGLKDYGVNVYALTGESSRKVSLSRQKATISAQCVYEDFTGSIPSGADSVVVEINDFTYIDMVKQNGTVVPMPPPTGMRTILRQVSFTGNRLVLGVPEPVYTDSSSSDTALQDSSSSSSSKTSRKSSTASSSSANSSSKSGNAKKFEGEVTSILPGSKAASSSTAGKKDASDQGPEQRSAESSAFPDPPEDPSADLAQLFRVYPAGDSLGAAPMVLGFTLLMAAVLAFLLLGGGKK